MSEKRTIKLPNGQTVTVNVPDGATNEQVLRFVKREFEAGNFSNAPVSPEQQRIPTGDFVPTQETLDTQQPRKKEPVGALDRILGAGEALGTLATGAVFGTPAMIAETGQGILDEAIAGNLGSQDAVNRIDQRAFDAMQNVTYQPQTQSAQQYLGVLGQAADPFAAIAPLTPQIQGAVTAAKMRPPSAVQPREVTIENIDKRIVNGKEVPNPVYKAVSKHFEGDNDGREKSIIIERLTSDDKKYVNQMINMIDDTVTKAEFRNRPVDIIGRQLNEKMQGVGDLRKKAADRMNQAVNSMQQQGMKIDVNDAFGQFIRGLNDTGLTITRGKDGFKISGTRAGIKFGDGINKSDVEALLNSYKGGKMSVKEAHELKRDAQKVAAYNTLAVKNAPDTRLNNAIKALASNLNGEIRPLSKAYAEGNDLLSSTQDSWESAIKMTGGMDLDSRYVDARLGIAGKRLAQNFNNRADVLQTIDDLDTALMNNGVEINTDLANQVQALGVLEQIFRTESRLAPFGFTSRIEQAYEAAASPEQAAIRATDKFLGKVFTKNEQKKHRQTVQELRKALNDG